PAHELVEPAHFSSRCGPGTGTRGCFRRTCLDIVASSAAAISVPRHGEGHRAKAIGKNTGYNVADPRTGLPWPATNSTRRSDAWHEMAPGILLKECDDQA